MPTGISGLDFRGKTKYTRELETTAWKLSSVCQMVFNRLKKIVTDKRGYWASIFEFCRESQVWPFLGLLEKRILRFNVNIETLSWVAHDLYRFTNSSTSKQTCTTMVRFLLLPHKNGIPVNFLVLVFTVWGEVGQNQNKVVPDFSTANCKQTPNRYFG